MFELLGLFYAKVLLKGESKKRVLLIEFPTCSTWYSSDSRATRWTMSMAFDNFKISFSILASATSLARSCRKKRMKQQFTLYIIWMIKRWYGQSESDCQDLIGMVLGSNNHTRRMKNSTIKVFFFLVLFKIDTLCYTLLLINVQIW